MGIEETRGKCKREIETLTASISSKSKEMMSLR